MPTILGIGIFIFVLVIVICTRKTRKKYHEEPVRYNITVCFKEKPTLLHNNQKLKTIGYWSHNTDLVYQVDSKINKDKLTSLIMDELHLRREDFSIRSTTDLFVPQ